MSTGSAPHRKPQTAGNEPAEDSLTDPRSFKRTATLTATIVVACFGVVTGIVGYIGRSSFAPKLIDQVFGISEYIQKREDARLTAALSDFRKHVDSGYSATFTYTAKSMTANTQIVFSAVEGQRVTLTAVAQSLGAPPTRFRIFVDNRAWGEPRAIPFTFVGLPITKSLQDVDPGGNTHFVRFVPEHSSDIAKLTPDAAVVIDAVVLVSNEKTD